MQSSSLVLVRLLILNLISRHITYVTYIGFSTKIPSDLEELVKGNNQNTKIAAFVVSRDGKHYNSKDRFKKMFDEDVDLFKNIQKEDDLEGTYKLFGPYEERQTANISILFVLTLRSVHLIMSSFTKERLASPILSCS